MFIDTHAHLFSEYFDNLDEVINNSVENNIEYIINNGSNDKTNKEVLELIANPHIYGALGIHPESADNYTEEDLNFIEKNLDNPKILAIGEIGLDYHYTKDNKDKQIELFERQLKMAQKHNIPVIIHSREATQDTINILKKYHVTGTIHSFSGSIEVANIYINMGFMLGVNGVITFKNANLKDVIAQIDLSNILLETDCPFLTPHPYRGERNEPKYVNIIAKFISDLKNISLNELATITGENVEKTYPKFKK